MRYCNSCGEKRDWPFETLVQVRGPCELCGVTQVCNDLHHSRLPMPEPKVKLSFAPIDAKDNDIIGIAGPNGMNRQPRSEYNTKLLYEATHDYLTRLKELQASIISDFAFQFKDDSGIKPEEAFCAQNCPCHCNKNGQALCELIGSDLNDLYYT